jgi:predicted nucleotidyltransferase
MTKVVSIRRRVAGKSVTPQIVAMERLCENSSQPAVAWITADRLAIIEKNIWDLIDIGESINSLPEELQDALEKAGFDFSSVFDMAFTAHFELSVAEETMRLMNGALAVAPPKT